MLVFYNITLSYKIIARKRYPPNNWLHMEITDHSMFIIFQINDVISTIKEKKLAIPEQLAIHGL